MLIKGSIDSNKFLHGAMLLCVQLNCNKNKSKKTIIYDPLILIKTVLFWPVFKLKLVKC